MGSHTASYQAEDLIQLFNQCFLQTYRTRLAASEGEPLYLPAADPQGTHQILFAYGYFRSALHEISHWCIAGSARRLQEDYGYWYAPDGRTKAQQAAFARVEVNPQALELILTTATGHPFCVSLDNLASPPTASEYQSFQLAVYQKAVAYLQTPTSLPARGATFFHALCAHYQRQPTQVYQQIVQALASIRHLSPP
ncbi:hypothetical protein SAMN05421831_10853 [Allopseudospirillum japonicum]|uniref:Elongation factor P hydroxylase n=1 Tax=Allopseudospirillum japonicum TaxID=64971 RepID=A0A1H6SU35_9GAMM|nr:elongation factor P hydroxylase [Allopseudospirillum japonicum]SEI71271.1 hypothetical protein SAMN05421831_10853 [Allopseudospirillum japonicum]